MFAASWRAAPVATFVLKLPKLAEINSLIRTRYGNTKWSRECGAVQKNTDRCKNLTQFQLR
jgi:hypothetical protein